MKRILRSSIMTYEVEIFLGGLCCARLTKHTQLSCRDIAMPDDSHPDSGWE